MDDKEADLVPPPPPIISNKSGGSAEGGGAGDWSCIDCGNINFARRTSCNRCHKSRGAAPSLPSNKKRKLGHEIGKAAAEKSRGLFSADDWQCNKCGNVNWARRQQCNVCNAPKFGEVEERTGFGGGYNDRGVVEYKEHESDDEYDEFGRRKKRRSRKDGRDDSDEETTKTVIDDVKLKIVKEDKPVKKEEKEEDEEEEEEEEEEDDDGDLSKYDLSDWGDSCESNNKTRNSKSRSRSRSRSPLSKKE